MIFTGIDYSLTAPAVAILSPEGALIATKHWAKQPKHYSHIQRIVWLADEITNFIVQFKPTVIAVEEYAFSASGRITSIAEGCGVLKCRLSAVCGIEPVPVPISSWKVSLMGKGHGRASKEEITQAINEKFNLTLTGKKGEQDIADAIGVAYHAWKNNQ